MLIRKETKTKMVAVTEIIYTYRCDVCGKEFTSRYDWSSWCSDACYEVIQKRRRKESIKRSTQRRKEGREEARKALPDTICAHCQQPFRPLRKDAKYCSVKCRQAAYRERKE